MIIVCSTINNETLTIISTFSINDPIDIGFSPDNQFAYILNFLTGSMGITVINLLTQTISNTISLGGYGFSSIAIDPQWTIRLHRKLYDLEYCKG